MAQQTSMMLPFFFVGFLLRAAIAVNDRPVVGVLTQPLGVELQSMSKSSLPKSYIASSYVKFAESAGARVVPIHYDAPEDELKELFKHLNGIIFPGGGTSFREDTLFFKAGKILYDLALAANDAGDIFPIHGTCLGYQFLMSITAQTHDVICDRCFESEGQPLPLDFTEAARKSNLFRTMSDNLFSATSKENLTENSHHSGIKPEMYDTNDKLHSFYTVLSTNLDYNGSRFVSTVEAQKYPITASQWHPEKNNFEWGSIGKLGEEGIPHTAHAVELSQHMANNFVSRARNSEHHFENLSEVLVENCATVKDPQGYFGGIYLYEDRTCVKSDDAWLSTGQDGTVVV